MKSKSGAMEMSVGTMVTIILLVCVLVLGIFFIQKIFGAGTNAIDSIDNEVQSEIDRLFERENKPLAIYPTSRDVILKKGDDPKGFAFSVKNDDDIILLQQMFLIVKEKSQKKPQMAILSEVLDLLI
jgi:predicted PurR-regulated permease PerM